MEYLEEINSEFGQCADNKAPDTEQSWKKTPHRQNSCSFNKFFFIWCTDELLPFEKYGHIIKDNIHMHRTDK